MGRTLYGVPLTKERQQHQLVQNEFERGMDESKGDSILTGAYMPSGIHNKSNDRCRTIAVSQNPPPPPPLWTKEKNIRKKEEKARGRRFGFVTLVPQANVR
eukprot:scaffold2358_cov160-Amphora_coffeaeformis.AAC.4